MHLLVSGDTGVDIGAAEHIEGHLSLFKEVGDSAAGELRVTRLEHSNEVILNCAHFAFGAVVPMVTRRHKTRDNIQTTHGISKVSREDIVKNLKFGFEAFSREELDGGEVSIFVCLGGFGRHRLDFNKIGVRMIQKKKIFDPKVLPVIGVEVGERCDGTTHISEHGMGGDVNSVGRGDRRGVVNRERGQGRQHGFGKGAAIIPTMTIEVAFSSGGSRGEVPGKEAKVEARERRENIIFKSKVEGCARRRTKRGMVKSHEVKRRTDRVDVAEKTLGERKVRRNKVQRGGRRGRNNPEIRRRARAS
jgi:hypothetical protein